MRALVLVLRVLGPVMLVAGIVLVARSRPAGGIALVVLGAVVTGVAGTVTEGLRLIRHLRRNPPEPYSTPYQRWPDED